MSHRRDIEGLRAVAVVAVLLFHFGVPGTEGGFIGVDVFFVISGFLITSLLVAERDATGSISLAHFYTRRIRRLLPISALVITSTVIAAAIWLEPSRFNDLAHDAFAAALFFVNMLFANRGADYLQGQLPPSPLQHYWSLAVEEQFYMIWPALISLVTIGAVRVKARLLPVLLVIVGVSFTASVVLTQSTPSWAFFALHTRAWELGLGALLAVGYSQINRIPNIARTAVGWVGLIVIAVCVVVYGEVTTFPGWVAAIPVAATVAVLAAGDDLKFGPRRLLGLAPMQYIGARSYSLYLWHWPALIIATSAKGDDLSAGDRWKLLLLVLVVSELGYRCVENPVRRSQTLATNRNFSYSLGAGLVCVGLLSGVALANYHPDLATGVVVTAPPIVTTTIGPAVTTTTVVTGPPTPISMAGVVAPQPIIDALKTKVVPDNLTPSLSGAVNDTSIIYENDCHQFFKKTLKPGCVFGDPKGTTTVALFGDSHTAQWFVTLNEIAKARHWKLLSLTQGGCPVIEVLTYNRLNKSVYKHCQPWREAVFKYMREQNVDVVVMSQYVRYQDAKSGLIVTPDQWRVGLNALYSRLQADGITPVMFADTPDPPGVPAACLYRNRKAVQNCTAKEENTTLPDVMTTIEEVSTDHGVSAVFPARWLCYEGKCPVVLGNILMYRDDNHISNTFAKWLTPLVDGLVGPFVDAVATYNKTQ